MKRFILFMIVTGMISGTVFATDDLALAQKVAQQGFRDFLKKAIDDKSRKQWGLAGGDNSETAQLGMPFKLMQIHPDCILNFKRTADLNTMLSFGNTYIFPISFNGTIKLMMTVDKFPGNDFYEIGSIGHLYLAREVEKVLIRWPRQKGYNPILCVNYQAYQYAFSIPEVSASNLTLIVPCSEGVDYAVLTSVDTAIASLKENVLQALNKGGE